MKKNKKYLIVILVILVIFSLFLVNYKSKNNDIYCGLSDEEIYERLKIWFNDEKDEIELISQQNGKWSGWKLICGYNGKVNIEPTEISLSQIKDYRMIFTVTVENDDGKSITKKYEKNIKVVGNHPEIIMRQKELTLNLNDDFIKEDWFEVHNLDNWILNVECNVDCSKTGKYYLTVYVVEPQTNQMIYDEMVINIIDKNLNKDGCSLIWVVDKEAVAEKGHYETIEVEEIGHWGSFLVSEEEGHYEIIHHEEKYHMELEGEEFSWFSFYDENREVRNVISSYELEEMNMTVREYMEYLGEWVFGFFTTTDWKQTGSHKVVDQEAWDEEVYIIDKPAVYEERYVIDIPAYSYRIWIVDVPKQNEIGHWENKCD